MLRLLLILALFALVVGCGGDSSPSAGGSSVAEDDGCGCGCGCGCGEEEAGSTSGGKYSPDQGTATITGVVKFEGKAPRRRPLDLGAEQFCVDAHSEPMLSESYVVGDGGELANVFVHVKKGLEGWKFDKAEGEVLLDQEGCQYKPHMVAAQTGMTLRVRNSDPIMHNVHGIDLNTKKDLINAAQAKQGLENTKDLRKPMFVYVKCDVHGWMGSHLMVVKHPFYAVTGEDGAFSLDKLPPGTYTIEAWHEKLGTKTQSVTVGDGESKAITFGFSK